MFEPIKEMTKDDAARIIRNLQNWSDYGVCTTDTDFANETRVRRKYNNNILYDAANKQWYLWDAQSGIWKKDNVSRISEMVKDAIRSITSEISECDNVIERVKILLGADAENIELKDTLARASLLKSNLAKWYKKCQDPARVNACLSLLKSSVAIMPDEFNKDDYLFNFANGTLDLRSMVFRKHDKMDRITYTCGWNYDPNAKCENFKKFVYRLFQTHKDRDDLVMFLRMSFGYCLTGNTDKQNIELFHGSGNNGKSVLQETIAATFGDYADALNGESLTVSSRGKVREDLAKLIGKRYVRVSEVGRGSTIDEEVVKHITGGSKEPMLVRKLYGSSFAFYPKCKIFWSFNHLPKIDDMTDSIWRRIKAVPFNEIIGENEKREMSEILAEHDEERSGILNWLIAGYLDLQEIGTFDSCDAVRVKTLDYKEDTDTLRPFIDECCEIVDVNEHPNYQTKPSDLYDIYCGWSYVNGYTRPWSMTAFGVEITERIGRENKRRSAPNGSYVYHGIRIQDGISETYKNPRKLEYAKKMKPIEDKKVEAATT